MLKSSKHLQSFLHSEATHCYRICLRTKKKEKKKERFGLNHRVWDLHHQNILMQPLPTAEITTVSVKCNNMISLFTKQKS